MCRERNLQALYATSSSSAYLDSLNATIRTYVRVCIFGKSAMNCERRKDDDDDDDDALEIFRG